jgi:hypothetical protein
VLRVNLSTGVTLKLDLAHDADAREWRSFAGDPSCQQTIRGVSIVRDGFCHVVPVPKRFQSAPVYQAELLTDDETGRLIAERVSCYVDAIRIDLTVYARANPPLARVDVVRTGKRRHMPPASRDDASAVPGAGVVDRLAVNGLKQQGWQGGGDALPGD